MLCYCNSIKDYGQLYGEMMSPVHSGNRRKSGRLVSSMIALFRRCFQIKYFKGVLFCEIRASR